MGAAPEIEAILVIETSVDDLTPAVAGFVLERALELGALDAYSTPIQMKKQRPGFLLTLLARPEQRRAMVDLLLRETTTLGVRVSRVEREVLPRQTATVDTIYGAIRVKIAQMPGGGVRGMPEFEDCRAAARRSGEPLLTVIAAAAQAFAALPPNSPGA